MSLSVTIQLAADLRVDVDADEVNNLVKITIRDSFPLDDGAEQTSWKTINLTKGRARALASALMGAAAEV